VTVTRLEMNAKYVTKAIGTNFLLYKN